MTEQTTTDNAAKLPGVDLARVALQQARLAAKNNGGESRPSHRATTVKRDGREPAGFAAVLAGLMADRAWDLPTTGGNILDQWADIATAVAPQLPHHVTAIAFHTEAGQLDLRPDSPTYATQLRLISPRIITAANNAVGTDAVRSIRVLAAGAAPTPHTAPSTPKIEPQAQVKTREMACPGYQAALAAHRSAAPKRPIDPAIAKAVERQTRAMRELSRRMFPEPEAVPPPFEQARTQRRQEAAATEAAARRRARAERAARQAGTTAAMPELPQLRTTARPEKVSHTVRQRTAEHLLAVRLEHL
ncbi:DciA family protein [Streptomyces buecherae]|uniref:DciA family protein n=1 Tax=Streptomyces buecherae TaxID=2763006 RepID=UPI00379CD3D8